MSDLPVAGDGDDHNNAPVPTTPIDEGTPGSGGLDAGTASGLDAGTRNDATADAGDAGDADASL